MNVHTLLDNFDLIADAPGGVPKLRELILQMAVRGKLVPQDQEDEPAGKDLKIITEPGAIPYAIPRGWRWTTLRSISRDLGQKVPEKRFTYIDVSAIDKDRGRIGEDAQILNANDAPSRARKIVHAGTVIYSTIRPYLLNIAVVDREFDPDPIVSTAFFVMHPFVCVVSRYLFYYLRSQPFTEYVSNAMTGMAYPAVNDSTMSVAPFPLPPLPEQKRIVAKVDELMKRCDELESRQKDRAARHKTLVASCLNAVTDPKKPNPNFIIHNSSFNLLFSSPESITELRKTILQLAVQGRLVPQDSSEEPALILLRDITAAKKELFNAGVIKSSDIKDPVENFNGPYSVPSNWCWTNVESVSVVGTGSTPSRSNPTYFSRGNIPWVTSSATSAETIDHADTMITEVAQKETRLRLYPPGTVIVALYGQGKTRGQSSTLGIAATINQACAAIQIPLAADTVRSYVLLVFKKMYDEIRDEAAGGAQPNLNVAKIKAMAVPFPPLPEQNRIVSKVAELMAMCDELESKLTQSNSVAEKLAGAVVNHMSL